jgi:alpha-N-arabinofuranosidase
MAEAVIVLDVAFVVGKTDPRLFGSFVEHLGRCVYGGIFEPGHPTADDNGFRQDVLELVRELGVTVIRYPGGNFVSGYNWEDGVAPPNSRPRRRELAWFSTETNAFVRNEFMASCARVSLELMVDVKPMTRGADEAQRCWNTATWKAADAQDGDINTGIRL